MDQNKCPHCGANIAHNEQQCSSCGASLTPNQVPPTYIPKENEVLYKNALLAKNEGRLKEANIFVNKLLELDPFNSQYLELKMVITALWEDEQQERIKKIIATAEKALEQENIYKVQDQIKELSQFKGQEEEVERLQEQLQAVIEQQKKRAARKKRRKITFIFTFIFILLALAGSAGYYFYSKYQGEEVLWRSIQSSPSLESINNYIQTYPNGKHFEEAEALLEAYKAWQQILPSNNFQECLDYMKKYPDSPLAHNAYEKADSLLWSQAMTENTEERYQQYLSLFDDGKHVNEAKEALNNIDQLKVTSDEMQMIQASINGFFSSLSNNSEEIVSFVSTTIKNFFGKKNATKADAVALVNRMKSDDDTRNFSVNNDLNVTKSKDNDGNFIYNVTCSVDEHRRDYDNENEKFISYTATIQLNNIGKIIAINMNKVSSY